MAATLALSNKQFSGAPHLAALHSNLTRAGYTTNSKPSKSDPMSAYRNGLNNLAMGSATSSNHSLHAALNATGGSMFGHEEPKSAPAAPKKRTTPKAGKASLSPSSSGNGSGKGKKKPSLVDRVKKFNNHGNNHRVLKAVTGAK